MSIPATISEASRIASATDLETKVLLICRRILRADDFGPTDNFFDAGGDSLMALTMLLEVERETGLTVAPDKVFPALTARELCQFLQVRNHQIADDLLQVGPVAIRRVRSGTSDKTLYLVHAFYAPAVIERLTPELSIATIAISDAECCARR